MKIEIFGKLKSELEDFINSIENLINQKKDKEVKELIESKLKELNFYDYFFHEGANYLEWKEKDSLLIAIERY